MKSVRTPRFHARTSRLFTFWMVVIMALAMLPALPSPGVEAGTEDPTPTPTSTPQGTDDQLQAQNGETDQPDEQLEPTPTPTSTPSGPSTITYTAEKRLCPPGYDLENTHPDTVAQECNVPLGGVTFTMTTDNQSYPGGQRTSDELDGEFSWNDIPVGTTYQVSETVPTGYGTPYTDCFYYTDQGGTSPQRGYAPTDNGTSAPVNAQPVYSSVICVWYNVPLEDEANHVTFLKYLCPPGYNIGAASANELDADCVTPQGGVSYDILVGSSDLSGQTNQDGSLTFEDVEYGSLQIREFLTTYDFTAARVFCYAYPTDGPPAWTIDDTNEVPATYDANSRYYQIAYEFQEGTSLTCLWYNLQADGGQPGTVHFYKYLCPPDIDRNGDVYTYSYGCREPQQGVTFEIIGPTADASGQTDEDGFVEFTSIPAESLVLRELGQPGYQTDRVYCYPYTAESGYTTSDDNRVQVAYDEISDSYTVQYDLEAGYSLVCFWYNVSTEDGDEAFGWVYAYKYVCPPGYDYESASRDDLWQNCTETPSGLEFSLTGPDNYAENRTTDEDGRASWEQVPAGPLTFTELTTAGYTLVKIYCGVAAQNAGTLPTTWQEGQYQGGYSFELPAGQYYHCEFYNVADEEYGTIIVTKYLCGPIATELNGTPSHDTYSQQCTDIGVGYSFELQGGGGSQQGTSDATGQVVWGNLTPDDYTLIETSPSSLGSYPSYCTTDPANGPWVNVIVQPDTAIVPLAAGETLYCHWFNAVTEDNTEVEFVKYVCAADFPYTTASYEDYIGACTETVPGVQYNVTHESGYSSSKATDAQGVVSWTTIPAGLTSFYEVPGPGYQPLAVYCSQSQIGGTETGPFQGYDLDAVDYHIEIGVQDGYRLVCHWFNLEVDTGDILIKKYLCPPTVVGRGGVGLDDYRTQCTTPGEGFTFSLFGEDTPIDEATTGPDGQATVRASEAGTYPLVEHLHPDYRPVAVYCIGGVFGETEYGQVPQLFEGFELNPGDLITCEWYNAPYEESPYEAGTVVLHKYLCPPGYPTEPLGGRSPNSHFFDGCQVPQGGINFNVEQNGQTVTSGETDASGTAVIPNVPTGTIRISELPREGYSPPKVFCAAFPVDAGPEVQVLIAYQEQTVESWGHTYEFEEGYYLDCYWFNIPTGQGQEGQPIQIILHKYLCTPGYEPEGPEAESTASNCSTPEEGVNFTVTGGDGQSAEGPTDVNGYAEFNGIAQGTVTIQETPREGYQTVAVYCYPYYTTPGTAYALPVTEGQISYYVAPGYKLECYWYNAEAVDYGHIGIYKYLCHEDYAYQSASRDDLYANCSEPHTGVEFTLTGASYNETRTSDAAGASWEELPPGDYSLTEAPPPGYYPVRIYCTQIPIGQPGPYEQGFSGQWTDYTASPDNILDIQLSLPAGYWIWCEWYNAPADEYGTVHVYKYLCPELYDYHSRHEWYAACTEAHAGVDYTLSGGGGYSAPGTTDADGYYSWTQVPAGPVTITESPPTGYVPVKVFCGEAQANTGTLPGSWQAHPLGSEWGITYHVPANYYVTCEWYNAPYEDEPPQVWIQKYHCPEGVGHTRTYHQFLSGCVTPGADVEYGIGYQGEGPSLSVTDAQGRIVLGDLDPGTLVIGESFPTGYAGVVVYCQYVTPHHAGSYQRAPVYQGQIALHLDYGYVITCYWFNLLAGHEPPTEATPTSDGHPQPVEPDVPNPSGTSGPPLGPTGGGTGAGGPSQQGTGPATLIITKYTCAEGYDLHGPDANVVDDCVALTEGIVFALTDDDEFNESATTDSEGQATWSDLEPKSYVIQETLPEGTQSAFIWTCRSDYREFQAEYPFTPFSYAGPDGRIGVTLVPGETLECDWYDVPEDQPGGEVTVTKYLCPGTTVIPSQCAVHTDGATIVLSRVDGSGDPVELTTDESGTATAPAEGSYTVTEASGTPCLMDSDAFDEQGNLVVNEGDTVELRIYNCGGAAEEEE